METKKITVVLTAKVFDDLHELKGAMSCGAAIEAMIRAAKRRRDKRKR